jgi:hypothetical protein
MPSPTKREQLPVARCRRPNWWPIVLMTFPLLFLAPRVWAVGMNACQWQGGEIVKCTNFPTWPTAWDRVGTYFDECCTSGLCYNSGGLWSHTTGYSYELWTLNDPVTLRCWHNAAQDGPCCGDFLE